MSSSLSSKFKNYHQKWSKKHFILGMMAGVLVATGVIIGALGFQQEVKSAASCEECAACQVRASACCHGLTSKSCDYSMCTIGSTCESDCGAAAECDGRAPESTWTTGDTCHYCTTADDLPPPPPGGQAAPDLCSHVSWSNKPSQNYYYGGWGCGFSPTCYYNCEIVCTSSGWSFRNCSSSTSPSASATGDNCTYYTCTASGYASPQVSSSKPSPDWYQEGLICKYKCISCLNQIGWDSIGESCSLNPTACQSNGDGTYSERDASTCGSSGCSHDTWHSCVTPQYACNGIASREDGDDCTIPGTCFHDNQCAEGFVCKAGTCAVQLDVPTWASPNHLSATQTTSQIEWDWNAATGATSYQVYNGGSCSGGVLQTVNAPATNWDEPDLLANTNYTRTIKACNAGGCSACSAAASAYTSANQPTAGAHIPTRTSITWKWNSGGAQSGFDFYNGTWTNMDGATETIETLPCGTLYNNRTVRAYNGDGDPTAETALSASTLACNFAPTAPSSIIYTAPATAYTNSTLTCEASGSTDPDNDPITYKYQFRDTGDIIILQNWSTTNTFPCATVGCDKGDTIYCHAKANDGTVDGPEGIPSTKAIVNAPPICDNITPTADETVQENNSQVITIHMNDPDGDNIASCVSLGPNPNYIDPLNQAAMTINGDNCKFTWTPNDLQAGAIDQGTRNFYTAYTFTVQATDDGAPPAASDPASESCRFKVTVEDDNRAPDLSDNTGAYKEIIEQTAGSFSLINNDPDSDNSFVYTYASNPVLPAVDPSPKGISLASPIIAPNKNSLFQWTPTYNQAYYNAAGTALQPYAFTFTVDDQRKCPGCADSHNVAIKIIDVNRAPVFEMVASPLAMSENGTIDILIKARDNDWDYKNNRGDKIKFSLTGYTLIAQEVPLDDASPSWWPYAANLQIIGQEPVDPADITNLVINGAPIDFGTVASDCQIYVGPPAYTECQQTLRVDLISMYDHMGWHTFTFAATDDRHGNDIAYEEDNPQTATYPLLVQAANVNRAPEAPAPDFPDDDPAFQDHNLIVEPKYNPTNLNFTFYPKGDSDVWAHQDTVTYTLYIREWPGGNFISKGVPIVLDAGIVASFPDPSQTINVNDLSSRTDYEWYIEAKDDAPPQATAILTTDSPRFKFRTGMVNCTNGRECRKGEVCYDDDDDDGTSRVCKNFDECDKIGEDCYLSACNPNITDDPAGPNFNTDGSCALSSFAPGERIFALTQSLCQNSICDLPAVMPYAPEPVADADGVFVSPLFKWTDSDPPEEWLDYRSVSIGYLGTQTRYKFYIDNDKATDTFDYFHPPVDPPFDWSLADLDYKPVNEVNRLFSFTDMTGEYLNFNEAYKWKAEAYTNDGNDPVMGPEWQFNTKSVCDILEYAYLFDGQSFTYNPDNNQTAPDGPLPVGVELKWPPEDYYLVNDILKGPGAGDQALYDLSLYECDLGGSCGIENRISTGVSQFYSFHGAPLNYNKMYIWQAVVHHGRFEAEITTACPVDGNFFITPDWPGVNLTKTIDAVSPSIITYKIGFTVTGESWQRIKDFYIRDNFPNFVDEVFNYTFLDDVGAAYGDDKLIVREPDTLQIDSEKTGEYNTDSYIKWYIKDTVGDGSVVAGSSGFLIITLDQDSDIAEHVEAGECIWLTNQVYAGGIDERCVIEPCSDEFKFNTGENPVYSPAYLAGTENIDKSFLSSQQGNIHSNVNICLQNAPPSALDVYTGDYFITAGGEENVPEDWLRKGGDYRKINFFLEQVEDVAVATSGNEITIIITKTGPVEQTIKLGPGVIQDGPCNVDGDAGLFGDDIVDGKLVLGGKTFLCKDNGAGGDLTVDEELIINNQGGYGTVIVDGDLLIKDDIYYSNDTIDNINKLASLGWIVLGDVRIEEYPIAAVSDCYPYDDLDKYPQSKWCDDYTLVVDPDGAGPLLPELTYGAVTVGPVHIVGTFLVIGEGIPYVGGNFYTGKIHLPLQVEGSIIANKVVLQRREFPD